MANGCTVRCIKAEVRAAAGSHAARSLRASGKVPAVIYGRLPSGEPGPVHHVAVDARETVAAARARGRLVEIEFEGRREPTIFQEIQWDTFGRKLLHVDFVRIDPTKPIETELPVMVRGRVSQENTRVSMVHEYIRVAALPDRIPDFLFVAAEGLVLEQPVRVKDLLLPEGVTALTGAEEVVLVLRPVREEAPKPEAPLEGEEAAAGEPAEEEEPSEE